jgi:hypothetical protein
MQLSGHATALPGTKAAGFVEEAPGDRGVPSDPNSPFIGDTETKTGHGVTAPAGFAERLGGFFFVILSDSASLGVGNPEIETSCLGASLAGFLVELCRLAIVFRNAQTLDVENSQVEASGSISMSAGFLVESCRFSIIPCNALSLERHDPQTEACGGISGIAGSAIEPGGFGRIFSDPFALGVENAEVVASGNVALVAGTLKGIESLGVVPGRSSSTDIDETEFEAGGSIAEFASLSKRLKSIRGAAWDPAALLGEDSQIVTSRRVAAATGFSEGLCRFGVIFRCTGTFGVGDSKIETSRRIPGFAGVTFALEIGGKEKKRDG